MTPWAMAGDHIDSTPDGHCSPAPIHRGGSIASFTPCPSGCWRPGSGRVSIMPQRPAETSLYSAVKAYLESLGLDVKGECCGCDIVGVRPGEAPFLVVTELKLGFTLDLVLQGVERLAAAD